MVVVAVRRVAVADRRPKVASRDNGFKIHPSPSGKPYPPLVEHFKFFRENISEKCFAFCNNFSPRTCVKNLKLFHHFLILFQIFHLKVRKY
jgi:hypothetical protein